jgi:hypothetical protein
MDNRIVNIIYYSDPTADVKSGYRTVEIYAYGVSKAGNPVILCWLRNDFSKSLRSGKPHDAVKWRMYRLDRITSFQNTIQKFDTSKEFVSRERPKLNLLYRNMGGIYKKIIPN